MELTVKELDTQLKRYERKTKEAEKLLARYQGMRATFFQTDNEVPLDERMANQILKLYNDSLELTSKSASTIELCLNAVEQLEQDLHGDLNYICVLVNSPLCVVFVLSCLSQNLALDNNRLIEVEPPTKKQKINRDASESLLGRQVAAFVCQNKKQPKEWILCRVVKELSDNKRVEVEDEEPDEEGSSVHRRYTVQWKHIIPIPQVPEKSLKNSYTFLKNTKVLAMFPGTTAFYEAHVLFGPKKKKLSDYEYALTFKDDEPDEDTGPQGCRRVKVKFVLPWPSDVTP